MCSLGAAECLVSLLLCVCKTYIVWYIILLQTHKSTQGNHPGIRARRMSPRASTTYCLAGSSACATPQRRGQTCSHLAPAMHRWSAGKCTRSGGASALGKAREVAEAGFLVETMPALCKTGRKIPFRMSWRNVAYIYLPYRYIYLPYRC
jgi:hypothetical protein